jgi:hypothetical protein
MANSNLSVHRKFFDLGGQSVLPRCIPSELGEIGKAISRQIPIAALFRNTTVRSLAEYLVGERNCGGILHSVKELGSMSIRPSSRARLPVNHGVIGQ